MNWSPHMEETEKQMNGKARARKRAKRVRSAVTSGRKLFVDGDPNSAWARRYHDLAARHASDLGGPAELSEAQISLIPPRGRD
jgi:hypothetical protein